jgi:hypothetical protein
MTISPERKKLIERITKLFALADSTEHSEEAENARRMAIELMARHNISSAENPDKEEFGTTRVKSGFKRRHLEETSIINAVAKLSNVYFVSGLEEHIYSGRPSDISAMEYMLDLVMQQRVKAYHDYKTGLGLRKPDRNRWLNGFAIGVCEKIRQISNATERKQREWALVPVSVKDQAKDYYLNNGGRSVTSRRSSASYCSSGYEAGRSVNLARGVDARSATRLLR